MVLWILCVCACACACLCVFLFLVIIFFSHQTFVLLSTVGRYLIWDIVRVCTRLVYIFSHWTIVLLSTLWRCLIWKISTRNPLNMLQTNEKIKTKQFIAFSYVHACIHFPFKFLNFYPLVSNPCWPSLALAYFHGIAHLITYQFPSWMVMEHKFCLVFLNYGEQERKMSKSYDS